jgi:hypothetical protein
MSIESDVQSLMIVVAIGKALVSKGILTKDDILSSLKSLPTPTEAGKLAADSLAYAISAWE